MVVVVVVVVVGSDDDDGVKRTQTKTTQKRARWTQETAAGGEIFLTEREENKVAGTEERAKRERQRDRETERDRGRRHEAKQIIKENNKNKNNCARSFLVRKRFGASEWVI